MGLTVGLYIFFCVFFRLHLVISIVTVASSSADLPLVIQAMFHLFLFMMAPNKRQHGKYYIFSGVVGAVRGITLRQEYDEQQGIKVTERDRKKKKHKIKKGEGCKNGE